MILDTDYCCVTFQNVHTALRFERDMKAHSLQVRLIPVPRKISATCGMAARVSLQEWEAVKTKMLSEQLEFEKVFHITKNEIKEVLLMS